MIVVGDVNHDREALKAAGLVAVMDNVSYPCFSYEECQSDILDEDV